MGRRRGSNRDHSSLARRSRVLVVGGGFIGSHVCRSLTRAGYPATLLTRTPPSGVRRHLTRDADLIVGDLSTIDHLGELLHDIDHVIFTAGGLPPRDAQLHPDLNWRLTMPPLARFLDAMTTSGAKTFWYLSSGGTVYGDPATLPTPEDSPTAPLSAYGHAKLASEQLVIAATTQTPTAVHIVRVSNAYGPGQDPTAHQGIIGTALNHAARDEPLTIFGDGTIARDFVTVTDVADVLTALLDTPRVPTVINVGSGRATTLLDALVVVNRITGHPLRVTFEASRSFDVPRSCLDISLLSSLTGFVPTPLEAGVEAAWRSLVGPGAVAIP